VSLVVKNANLTDFLGKVNAVALCPPLLSFDGKSAIEYSRMMNVEERPVCYIIAGPNGAGKTTFALRYLPRFSRCNSQLHIHVKKTYDEIRQKVERYV